MQKKKKIVLEKPWSEACERNWKPILEVMRRYFTDSGRVLEIGSGTGQHAVRFAAALPHVEWQATERAEALPGLCMWVDEAGLRNLKPPLELDVCNAPWPLASVSQAFTANTLHIMSWEEVCCLFSGVGRILQPGGHLLVYGPFCRQGRHTTPSNARFDAWLRNRDPASGVRDLEAVDEQAARVGLHMLAEHPMPANNLLLVWKMR